MATLRGNLKLEKLVRKVRNHYAGLEHLPGMHVLAAMSDERTKKCHGLKPGSDCAFAGTSIEVAEFIVEPRLERTIGRLGGAGFDRARSLAPRPADGYERHRRGAG